VEIIEATACPDHIHMLYDIEIKYNSVGGKKTYSKKGLGGYVKLHITA